MRYHRGLDFGRAVRVFNARAAAADIIKERTDQRGRVRRLGAGPLACALNCLYALQRRQRRRRDGLVYVGYEGLGAEYGRSRSTAYRSVVLLLALGLIRRESGGGKTYTQEGELVGRANGYQLADELSAAPGRRPPKRPPTSSSETPGGRLAEDARQRWVDARRAARAGPAPP